SGGCRSHRWSSAREVIAKIREWRASRAGIEARLTGGIELRGGKNACDVAVKHFAAEGIIRSGLLKYADTPEGRQVASVTDDDYRDLQRIVYGDCGVNR